MTWTTIKMFHTSPNLISNNSINDKGIAGDCLFFSDDVYVVTMSDIVYVYEADFTCIAVNELHDEEIIEEVSYKFDCDAQLAENLLDGSENEWNQAFDIDAEDSWWLQGKKGECAKKMGYDGCQDVDEQGTVYIIPMKNKENQLELKEVIRRSNEDVNLFKEHDAKVIASSLKDLNKSKELDYK